MPLSCSLDRLCIKNYDLLSVKEQGSGKGSKTLDEEKQAHKIKVLVKDWGLREVEPGTTILDLLREIGGKLAKEALAAKIDGKVIDLNTPVYNDLELAVLTFDDPEGMQVYRHTASHVLAQAVKNLYGNVRLGIGPAIRDGYYYDFDFDRPISPEELTKIEEQMRLIIKEDLPLERIELDREEAIGLFSEMGEKYKVELVEGLDESSTISVTVRAILLICAGPHLPSTGKLKAIKLLNLAGAYWRAMKDAQCSSAFMELPFLKQNNWKNTCSALRRLKADHRRLGRELDLFSFREEGPGFLLSSQGYYYQAGAGKLWREEHRKAGYLEIETPVILNRQLWEQSGHWDHYQKTCIYQN